MRHACECPPPTSVSTPELIAAPAAMPVADILNALDAAAGMPMAHLGIAAAVSMLGVAIMPKGSDGRARLSQIGTGLLASFIGRLASSPPAVHEHPATQPVPSSLVRGADRWASNVIPPVAAPAKSWLVISDQYAGSTDVPDELP